MDVTTESARRTTRATERLAAEYGEFDVFEAEWRVSGDEYDSIRARHAAGTLGGAGVWLPNDDGAVLLVREGDEWSEPGGHHEPGESLAETARRELREETGLDCRLAGVALLQRVTVLDRAAPDRPPIHRVIATFDGEYLGGTPRPRDDEVSAVRWWTSHPADLNYDALTRLEIPAADGT